MLFVRVKDSFRASGYYVLSWNVSLPLPPSLPLSFESLSPPPFQEIQQLRQEIDAQGEIIVIMGEALKENEKRHETCPQQEKQL